MKRYDLEYNEEHGGNDLIEREDGKWVEYEDAKKLIEGLGKRQRELIHTIDDLEHNYHSLKETLKDIKILLDNSQKI